MWSTSVGLRTWPARRSRPSVLGLVVAAELLAEEPGAEDEHREQGDRGHDPDRARAALVLPVVLVSPVTRPQPVGHGSADPTGAGGTVTAEGSALPDGDGLGTSSA